MVLLFYFVFSVIGQYGCVEQRLNNRPIIGVLAQEVVLIVAPGLDENISYIPASYVKFLESAGARVVPVMINKTDDYYEHIANQVNGILLPGGGTYFDTPGGYAEAGQKLYQLAMRMNREGDYFPMLGICLGFELLTYLASNNVEHRARCYSYNETLPLAFSARSFDSRLFANAPTDIVGILTKENVTANYHYYCLTRKNMTDLNLDHDWRFMTTSEDSDGLEYISTLEHREYPLYGLQFHPEKNIYEWGEDRAYNHAAVGIRVSQYFANFFVNEARKSQHKFHDESEERRHLIHNYPVTYTGENMEYQQCYAFEI